jgi:ATP-dependent helicase/nuclease subunit B
MPRSGTEEPSTRTPPDPGGGGRVPGGPAEEGPARRRFVGRGEPLLPVAARLLLQRAPEAERRIDLRDVLVVLPGSRAGRRLAELLLEGAEARGRALLPPEITTVGDLPERFYVRDRPEPDPVLDGLAWRIALDTLTAEERARLTAAPPAAGDEEGWDGIARTLRRLHREVAAGGWSFRQVAERCAADGLLFNDEERWRLLARVQDRYREILAAHGRRDREEARWRALAGDEAALHRELWLVGVTDLPPVARRFLREAHRVAPHTVVIPAGEEEAEGFDELGTLKPGWWADRDVGVADEAVRVAWGPGDQASAVVEALAELDAGRYAPEEVAVGVPDPDVLPFLVERLEAAGAPVRWAGGRPVHRTAPFRLLEALADYLEGREYEAFAALVRHPEVDRALRRQCRPGVASIPALADRFHALHLPVRLDRGRLPGGGEGKGAPVQAALSRVRDALDRLLAPMQRSRPLSEWPAALQEILVRIHGDRALDRGREDDRETIHVAAAMREILQAMEALPPGLDRPVAAHRALRMLLGELRGGTVPAEPDREAVELLGWLELALDDAPVVVVTGVNEPRLPEAITAHPFLPHALRSRLGLLDNPGRWARDFLHLRMVLEGRDHALLVAGRCDSEGNPLRLSRLLLTGPPEAVARRILAFLGDGEAATGPAASGTEAGSGREATQQGGEEPAPGEPFRLPPEPVLSASAPPEQIRVTQFRRVLADPYVWALEGVLELDSVDDRAREMDGALFGTLAHAVLEAWGRSGEAGARDAARVRSVLEAHLDTLARDRFGSRPLPAVRLQLEQLRARLGAFAGWQASWRARGWEIRAVEAAPESPGVPFEVDGVPVRLRGRIDRVDHHPGSGAWLLLDYKIGDRVSTPDEAHRRGRAGARRWVDLQLPLYLQLAPALRDEEGEALIPRAQLDGVGVGFLALPRERSKVCELLADWDPGELREADETAREVIRLLRRNRFEFVPGETRARAGSPLAPLLGMGVMAHGGGGEPEAEGRGGDR